MPISNNNFNDATASAQAVDNYVPATVLFRFTRKWGEAGKQRFLRSTSVHLR
jgi:hypothetical protein